MRVVRGYALGRLLSNTWIIYPKVWDNPGKLGIIPDRPRHLEFEFWFKGNAFGWVCGGLG